MAGESVRDLVVRMSFQHGDTKNQIAGIRNELKLLDSGFAASTAAAAGFSTGMNQSAARVDLLRQKISLQQQVVDKYGEAIKKANEKLQKSIEKHAQDGQKLEEARQKREQLSAQIEELKAAMSAEKKASGESTEEYIRMDAALEELKTELDQTRKNIADLEGAYSRSDQAMNRNARSIQKLSIAENEAKAEKASMQQQLEAEERALKTNRAAWEAASQSLHSYAESVRKVGQVQQSVGKVLNRGTAAIAYAGITAGRSAVQWESDFAGVRKTVNGTAEELERIEQDLLNMPVPTDYSDLAAIAANAGQLGIQTANVTGFTRTMADLAETTDLTAEAAAQAGAQYANITGMNQANFDRWGSTVVELGNNLATTESKTVDMSMAIAAAGKQAGMTDAQILGLAGGLASLGLESQAGGTAFSRALIGMQVAVETGSDDMKKYAEVCGMTSEQFRRAFGDDATGTFIRFVQGLSSGSQSAIVMLDEMGITETRLRDMLLRASNAGDLLTGAVNMANTAWQDNVALTNEANVRYQTTASRMQMVGKQAQQTAMRFGKDLMPYLEKGMDAVDGLLTKFEALDETQRQQIITWAAYAASVGPVLTLVGKANGTIGSAMEGLSKFAGAMVNGAGGAKGLLSALSGLLGPAGILAVGSAALYGAYRFVDWASGAQAAREAIAALNAEAKNWQETQAATLYDTGTSDPLGRFGLSQSDFGTSGKESRNWIASLIDVWTDGKAETGEIVKEFTDGFTGISDGIREKITAQGDLLRGYDALTPEVKATMDADLSQLDAWDREISTLLQKRQNGYLSDGDQERLNEIVQARAEIEVRYLLGDGSGYDDIITQMQAELARLELEDAVDPTLFGDVLTALADGRKAYMDALKDSYDAEYAQINAIGDETAKTAALMALNERYNAQRLEGEEAYAEAIRQAGAQAWQEGGYTEQIGQIEELAKLLASTDGLDFEGIQNLVSGMDEGQMTSMLALVEQLKRAGMSDDELGSLGINYEALLGTITAIRDAAADIEGLDGVADIFGTALPEEVQRILIGLDMTQAAEDWAAFVEGASLTEVPLSIALDPLDQASVDTWMANMPSDLSLKGPTVKVGVAFGGDWDKDIETLAAEGKVKFYNKDGIEQKINGKVGEVLNGNDLVAGTDENGVVHIIMQPEWGSREALDMTGSAMEEKPGMGVLTPLMKSVQDKVDVIVGKADAIRGLKQDLKELNDADVSGENFREIEMVESGIIARTQEIREQFQGLSEADLAAIGMRMQSLIAAINSGDYPTEDVAAMKKELDGLKSVMEAIEPEDATLTGTNVAAGIAAGMTGYDFATDAATLQTNILSNVNDALGVHSPATTMEPTGGNTAAGIGKGMQGYSFAADAAAVAGNITAAFNSLPSQGRLIGQNFGRGLYRGLESEMSRTLALARSYANRITSTFRSAWDIHSPSGVAEGLTQMFGAGLAKGMESWPRISERVLEEDIGASGRNVNRAARVIYSNTQQSYDQQSHVSVQVDKMEVRDQSDVSMLAYEIADLTRSRQRGKGMRY